LPAVAAFGEEVPVPITTFSPLAAGGIATQPITSYTYRNIGVNIEITPRAHLDNDVTLTLKLKVNSISGEGFGGLPTFGNREVTTQIRLKDGETNMLAGLIRDEERKSLDGIPGISDLPLIGHIFGHAKNQRDQTDVILMLTPHIVRVLDLTEDDLRAFVVGPNSAAGAGGFSTPSDAAPTQALPPFATPQNPIPQNPTPQQPDAAPRPILPPPASPQPPPPSR
jgi:general secretion pathway protein D